MTAAIFPFLLVGGMYKFYLKVRAIVVCVFFSNEAPDSWILGDTFTSYVSLPSS